MTVTDAGAARSLQRRRMTLPRACTLQFFRFAIATPPTFSVATTTTRNCMKACDDNNNIIPSLTINAVMHVYVCVQCVKPGSAGGWAVNLIEAPNFFFLRESKVNAQVKNTSS